MNVMDIYKAICAAFGTPDVEPKILGKAQDEIKDQYLDATKARNKLGWDLKVRPRARSARNHQVVSRTVERHSLMSAAQPLVSVVCPVFNEEEGIREFYDRLTAVMYWYD